jgi:hypothetical protein
MGCNFAFFNVTRMNRSIAWQKLPSYLSRNIDRGSHSHLLAVFYAICEINNWSATDVIEASCCCQLYQLENGVLQNLHDTEWVFQASPCVIPDCVVCQSRK